MVIWIIGLSGAGKTTLATKVVGLIREKKKNVVLIDGDVIRDIFGGDLGHSLEDRFKNAERICQLGKFLESQDIHVVVAILSLFLESREWNRKNLKNYYEVFIDTPINDLIKRDSKGLYSKYNRGEIENVAGLDLKFDKPANADLIISNKGTNEDLLKYADQIALKVLSP